MTTVVFGKAGERAAPRRPERPRAALLLSPLLCASMLFALCLALPGKDKPATFTIAIPPKPDFSDLDWLVGEWTGKTAGKNAQGDVHLSAAYEFDKRFLILREETSLPATKNAPAVKESWMGILTRPSPGGSFAMQVYSSTGFVTTYGVTLEGGKVYLNQQGGEDPPAGWLFRRVLERTDPGSLNETVRVAPPDQPFFDYYTARLSRVSGAGPTASVPLAKPAAPSAKPSQK